MGILNPLYDLVAWLIMHIHAVLGSSALGMGEASGTRVLTIVVLVVLMRLVLLPLFIKQMHSQRKMVALAPELSALRKRYKNDKQKLQEEMMKLYKENGANPLSGCLPLVAQLPLWFALLNVLRAISEHKVLYGMTTKVVAEANNARIFGVSISDKFLFVHPAPALHIKVVIAITVLISAVTTFLSVRQSTKRGLMQNPTATDDNPMAGAQKYMVYIAPLFALSGLYWQYGLVVYWLTSNIWRLRPAVLPVQKIPPLAAVTSSPGFARRPPPPLGDRRSGRRRGPRRWRPGGLGRPRSRDGQPRSPGSRVPRQSSRVPRQSSRVPRQSSPRQRPPGSPAPPRSSLRRPRQSSPRQPPPGSPVQPPAVRAEKLVFGEERGGRARHPAAHPERKRRHAAQADQGTRRARAGAGAARGHGCQAAADEAVAEQAHGQAVSGSPLRDGWPARAAR